MVEGYLLGTGRVKLRSIDLVFDSPDHLQVPSVVVSLEQGDTTPWITVPQESI
jgi:hypothetical protein